jgi:multidrug transporter EmrE-like cation transporter
LNNLKKLSYVAWWLALILFDTAGQLSMKMTAQTLKETVFGGLWLSEAMSTFSLWAALICYTASFLVWLNILKQTELSVAFPVSSLNYITILFASWLLFQEPIGPQLFLGVMLIVMGVIFIT